MSATATTYFVNWQRVLTLYKADPSGQFLESALEARSRQDEADEAQSTPGADSDRVLDWFVEDPIEACRVYENFHFWTDFADLYCRMRSDIPTRHRKLYDAFVGGFCPSMSDEVDDLFAPLQDLGPGGQELCYMSISPQTAAQYLELGERLKFKALKKAFNRNYNRVYEEEEEDEYERDDFDNAWGYWVWRIKASLKPRRNTGSILSDDEITFHDLDGFTPFMLAWIEVLKYAVQNDKGILITVA